MRDEEWIEKKKERSRRDRLIILLVWLRPEDNDLIHLGVFGFTSCDREITGRAVVSSSCLGLKDTAGFPLAVA